MADDATASSDLLTLTAEIVSSHVGSNQLALDELPNLIRSVHTALAGLGKAPEEPVAAEHVAATTVRKSLANPKHLISFIDGRRYTALKRHLASHGLTPAGYRERYGLKPDYPMVAPAYAEMRRAIAKTTGLGRKAGEKIVEAAAAVEQKVEELVAPTAAAKRRHRPKAEQVAAGDTAKGARRTRNPRRQAS